MSTSASLLKSCAKEKRKGADVSEVLYLDRLEKAIDQYRGISVYTVSFSEDPDLLSQWRGYASPGGVSLGFLVDDLRKVANKQGFCLFKCIYEEGKKKKIAIEILEWYCSHVRASESSDDKYIENICYQTMGDFYQVASLFKHKSFSEEKEWRLVSKAIPSNSARVDVRARGGHLIPFFHFSIDTGHSGDGLVNLCFDCLKIGPVREINLQEDAVMILLSRSKVLWRTMSRSEVPYRIL